MKSLIETFVEVQLLNAETPEKARVAFLKTRETLTRIGIASRRNDKTLFQSCHILHKKNRYYIVHFKEMLALDGLETDYSDDDRARRNTIAKLLQDFKLVKIISPESITTPLLPLKNNIKVLHFQEKKDWKLKAQYVMGKKVKR